MVVRAPRRTIAVWLEADKSTVRPELKADPAIEAGCDRPKAGGFDDRHESLRCRDCDVMAERARGAGETQ